MTKISIIIPVYNAQDYLARCLDTVVNQTLKETEIICVNDCSKDNSLQILNKYAEKYANIKVIDCKENGGESVARNIGIDNAIGKYLAFVDNDDIVDLDFYEKLYTEAERTGADITKAEAKEIYYDGKIFTRNIINRKIKQTGCKAYFTADWWTAIYKRDFINKNNLRLPDGVPLGGDILFLSKAVIAANKVAIIDGTYYIHIMRENSGDSKYCSLEKIKSALNIFKQIIIETNNADINNIKPEGYDYIFWTYTLGAFFRAFKNNEIECKKLCAETTIEIYNLCKRKDALDKCITEEHYNFIIPFLHESNIDGLAEILINSPSLDRLRIEILRTSVIKNLSTSKGKK